MLKFIYKDKQYEILADRVAYDGCHKIYLITDYKDEGEALDAGYELWGVDYLPVIWDGACPLRFIQFWDVEHIHGNIIPQCTDAKIERVGIDIVISLDDQDLSEEYQEWMEQWIQDFMKNGVLVYA